MNDLYTKAREALLRGEWSWEDDTFTVAFLDASYTPNMDTDEFASSALAAVIAAATLTGCTVLPGALADADDVTTMAVPLGVTVAAVVVWKDTGDPATSTLILFDDENEDYTPIGRPGTGAAVPLLWSNVGRVFAI